MCKSSARVWYFFKYKKIQQHKAVFPKTVNIDIADFDWSCNQNDKWYFESGKWYFKSKLAFRYDPTTFLCHLFPFFFSLWKIPLIWLFFERNFYHWWSITEEKVRASTMPFCFIGYYSQKKILSLSQSRTLLTALFLLLWCMILCWLVYQRRRLDSSSHRCS